MYWLAPVLPNKATDAHTDVDAFATGTFGLIALADNAGRNSQT